MSSEPPQYSGAMPDDAQPTGEPIIALRELEENSSASFFGNIRNKIQRREAASHLAFFSWQVPGIVFIELGSILAHIVNALSSRKGDEP